MSCSRLTCFFIDLAEQVLFLVYFYFFYVIVVIFMLLIRFLLLYLFIKWKCVSTFVFFCFSCSSCFVLLYTFSRIYRVFDYLLMFVVFFFFGSFTFMLRTVCIQFFRWIKGEKVKWKNEDNKINHGRLLFVFVSSTFSSISSILQYKQIL